jgi:hypothetical protein
VKKTLMLSFLVLTVLKVPAYCQNSGASKANTDAAVIIGSGSSKAIGDAAYTQVCGDGRTALIQEYRDHAVRVIPVCADFSRDAQSVHFSFALLNTGDHDWAILRPALLAGLEAIYTQNGNRPIRINSAYRNPARNAKLPGSARNSRHLYGDAVDIASDESTWEHFRAIGIGLGGCVEPVDLSGTGHVHVDWRGRCPAGWN